MCDCFWSRTVKLQRCFRGPTMSRQCLWRSPAQLRQSRQEITEALRSLILAAQDYPSVLCGKQSTMKQPCRWKGKMNENCNKRWRLAVSLSPSPSQGFRRVDCLYMAVCGHMFPFPSSPTMPHHAWPVSPGNGRSRQDWRLTSVQEHLKQFWNIPRGHQRHSKDSSAWCIMSMAALNTVDHAEAPRMCSGEVARKLGLLLWHSIIACHVMQSK